MYSKDSVFRRDKIGGRAFFHQEKEWDAPRTPPYTPGILSDPNARLPPIGAHTEGRALRTLDLKLSSPIPIHHSPIIAVDQLPYFDPDMLSDPAGSQQPYLDTVNGRVYKDVQQWIEDVEAYLQRHQHVKVSALVERLRGSAAAWYRHMYAQRTAPTVSTLLFRLQQQYDLDYRDIVDQIERQPLDISSVSIDSDINMRTLRQEEQSLQSATSQRISTESGPSQEAGCAQSSSRGTRELLDIYIADVNITDDAPWSSQLASSSPKVAGETIQSEKEDLLEMSRDIEDLTLVAGPPEAMTQLRSLRKPDQESFPHHEGDPASVVSPHRDSFSDKLLKARRNAKSSLENMGVRRMQDDHQPSTAVSHPFNQVSKLLPRDQSSTLPSHPANALRSPPDPTTPLIIASAEPDSSAVSIGLGNSQTRLLAQVVPAYYSDLYKRTMRGWIYQTEVTFDTSSILSPGEPKWSVSVRNWLGKLDVEKARLYLEMTMDKERLDVINGEMRCKTEKMLEMSEL